MPIAKPMWQVNTVDRLICIADTSNIIGRSFVTIANVNGDGRLIVKNVDADSGYVLGVAGFDALYRDDVTVYIGAKCVIPITLSEEMEWGMLVQSNSDGQAAPWSLDLNAEWPQPVGKLLKGGSAGEAGTLLLF